LSLRQRLALHGRDARNRLKWGGLLTIGGPLLIGGRGRSEGIFNAAGHFGTATRGAERHRGQYAPEKRTAQSPPGNTFTHIHPTQHNPAGSKTLPK
jgi:hypothetical protein